jgi:hypothetical protein
METKSKDNSLKVILIIMTIGIWAVVLQNAGVIPTNQNVYVNGGHVKVRGSVDADVSGSVSVDNTVDINIQEILGRSAGSRRSYTIDGVEYQSLDVSVR